MICNNCGKENNKDAKYCSNCGAFILNVEKAEFPGNNAETGTGLPRENPQINPVYPPEEAAQDGYFREQSVNVGQYGQYAGAGAYYENKPEPSYRVNPIIPTARKAMSSPVALLATILYTLTGLIYVVLGFLADNYYSSSVFSTPGNLSYYLPGSVGDWMLFGLLGMGIATLIMALGLWLNFAFAANKKAPFKSAGLTLLKVIFVIRIVFGGLCVLLMIFLGILLSIVYNSSYYYYSEYRIASTIIIVGVIVVVALIMLLGVLYNIKLITTCNRMRDAAAYGEAEKKIPLYSIVIMALTGVSSFIVSFTYLVYPVAFILLIIPALSFVLLAAALINFREKLKRYM